MSTLVCLVAVLLTPPTASRVAEVHQVFKATEKGDVIQLKRLLQRNPSLANDDSAGRAPLYWAAVHGQTRAAEVLLAHGARLVSEHGDSAFDVAVWFGHEEVAHLLLDKGAKLTIQTAAGLGLTDKVADFLRTNKSLIKGKDFREDSPLHWASATGQIATADFLLLNNANIQEGSSQGTPLHVAAAHGRIGIAKFFLARKADVNATSAGGVTPLFDAIRRGHKDMVQLLIAHGADVNASTVEGLINACRASDGSPVVRMATPLHDAVERGNVAMVSLLLAHKANVNAVATGGAPLDLAVGQTNRAIADLLRLHGTKESKPR